MKESTFNDTISWLQRFHSTAISEAAVATWRAEFKTLDDDLWCSAVQISTHKLRPGLFPTVEKMRTFVEDARVHDHNVAKAAEPRKPLSEPRLGDIRNVERGKQGLALVWRVYNEGYTDDVMKELCERWPHHDWHAAKRECEQDRENFLKRDIRERFGD